MILNVFTLLLLSLWLIFWEFIGIKSNIEKAKTVKPKFINYFQRIFLAIPTLILFFNF